MKINTSKQKTKTQKINKMKKLAIATILVGCLIAFNSCKKPEAIAVEVKRLSITDLSLSGWDDADGPDVFFTLTDGGPGSLVVEVEVVENVTASRLPLTWNFSHSYVVDNVRAKVTVKVWDKDEAEDVEMGIVEFYMANYRQDHPQTVSVTQGDITVLLELLWTFDK